MERLAYRPDEAGAVVGVSRDVIYKALKAGELRSSKIGGVRLITVEALHEWLARHEQDAVARADGSSRVPGDPDSARL